MDEKFVDEESWACVVNAVYEKKTKTRSCFKRPTSTELTRTKCSNNEANRALCPESALHWPDAARRPVFLFARGLGFAVSSAPGYLGVTMTCTAEWALVPAAL